MNLSEAYMPFDILYYIIENGANLIPVIRSQGSGIKRKTITKPPVLHIIIKMV